MSGPKSWISAILLVMVCVAIYRISGGNVNNIVNTIWNIISKGADIITGLWHKAASLTTTSSTTPSTAVMFFNPFHF